MKLEYTFKTRTLLFSIIVIVYFSIPLLNNTQRNLNYWLMQKYITNQYERPINIVYFDEKDIEKLGGWPLNRNIYGFLAEKLLALGVKTIGFHVYWGERSVPNDENDFFLASILNHRKNIIGSYYFNNLGEYSEEESSFLKLQWNLDRIKEDLPTASGISSPDAIFLHGHSNFGFVNLPMSRAGIIEDAVLLVKCGQGVYPSFSNLIARYNQESNLDSGLSTIKINYKVDTNHQPTISVRELLQPENTDDLRSKLNDTIVFLGVISSQLGFEKSTPIDAGMPIIAIHAQIVDNIISGNYLKIFPCYMYLIIFLPFIILLNFIEMKNLWVTLSFYIGCAFIFIVVTLLLWTSNTIFQIYAYTSTLGLFIYVSIGHSIVQQKNRIIKEAEKRKQLESQFISKVQLINKLERDYHELYQRYKDEIEDLREELADVNDEDTQLLRKENSDIICSTNSPMIKILSELKRIGNTDAPVLILGESGTGKELVAEAIHRKSSRASQPFIVINCSALSENLLESELFGHEKGAFTGADCTKIGFFEAADQGSIFLDEISETSVSFQAKLLRVLQEGTFYKVGSTQIQKVNVRVIAATNQNIERLIEQGRLRQDLYFRLNVLSVNLPPLRDRPDDIQLLLSHFINNKNVKISTPAYRLLKSYNWPGNVRELQNIAERIKLLGEDVPVTSDWIRKQLQFKDEETRNDSFDEKVLSLFRELQFRNNANTIIAQKLGNLHRSTITEYLKGMTFQFFFEEEYHLGRAIRRFNPQTNNHLDQKIRNRMVKYLKNLCNKLDPNLSVKENIESLQTHMKKLPKKYHPAAVEITSSFIKGLWNL